MRLRASEGEEQGLGADSEEKREPASDIDIAVVDSLKVLDPNRPIREEATDHTTAPLVMAYDAQCVSHVTTPCLRQSPHSFRRE